ncbi:MAG TPA: shikimate kinase [Blastocatellia bacterium]|nr:shikimate kinase [Blastocatellia bacterium]
MIGFMGAGKTTVGRELARALSCRFVDLDELIEQRAGKAIRSIFAEQGEAEFRCIEREAIAACSELNGAVIALGGGAYVSEENRAVLREIGKTVWLDCPLEVCLKRIGDDPSRPLLGNEDEMRDLLERRREAYAQADYVVESGKRSPSEIACEIIALLKL